MSTGPDEARNKYFNSDGHKKEAIEKEKLMEQIVKGIDDVYGTKNKNIMNGKLEYFDIFIFIFW